MGPHFMDINDVVCVFLTFYCQAYLCSGASSIVGIEMNATFCALQREMVARHDMSDRVQIIEGDVTNHRDLLQSGSVLSFNAHLAADVVVMNNVFEFFSSIETQQKFAFSSTCF
jgi:hypothetical protein